MQIFAKRLWGTEATWGLMKAASRCLLSCPKCIWHTEHHVNPGIHAVLVASGGSDPSDAAQFFLSSGLPTSEVFLMCRHWVQWGCIFSLYWYHRPQDSRELWTRATPVQHGGESPPIFCDRNSRCGPRGGEPPPIFCDRSPWWLCRIGVSFVFVYI